MDVDNTITDERGYLLRDRPGSDIPIGPKAALLLSNGLAERDISTLMAVEQLGIVTTEQIARAFFNTQRSAYETLLTLIKKRFMANIGADSSIIRRAVGHRPPPRSPAYILDWNGAYYLANHRGYRLRNWRASTAALITPRFGHTVGIGEIWSYLLAAARATQELDLTAQLAQGAQGEHEAREAQDPRRYRLCLGFRNERASILTQRRASGDTSAAESAATHVGAGDGPSKVKDKVLLQPDATFTLAISEVSPPSGLAVKQGTTQDFSQDITHVTSQEGQNGQSVARPRPTSPRWDPTLNSWEAAFLSDPPSAEVMAGSERLVSQGAGTTYYRTLLLELETGANNSTDITSKIASYNRLIRTNQVALSNAYGISPRVLVVVRTDAQVEAQALIWRTHYLYKGETAVLLTSLQRLAKVYNQGSKGSRRRRNLIEHPCWLDVMADRWKTLSEALGIGVARSRG